MPQWSERDSELNLEDFYYFIVSLFIGDTDGVPASPEWAEETLNFYNK